MIKIIAYPCHREQIEIREKDQIVQKLGIFIVTAMLNIKLLLLHVKGTQQYSHF